MTDTADVVMFVIDFLDDYTDETCPSHFLLDKNYCYNPLRGVP